MNRGKCQWWVANLLGKQLPPSAILRSSTCTYCEINSAFNFYQTRKGSLQSVCCDCRNLCKGVQRSKVLNWRNIWLPVKNNIHSLVDEHNTPELIVWRGGGGRGVGEWVVVAAVNARCWFSVLSNPCRKIEMRKHLLLYLPWEASSFLILACVACSHVNHISKYFYISMMSPLCWCFKGDFAGMCILLLWLMLWTSQLVEIPQKRGLLLKWYPTQNMEHLLLKVW